MRRPRAVLMCCGFAVLVLAGFALNIDYDHNLLNLQAPRMDSVQWEKKLTEKMSDSSWYAVSWTTTPEEALALKAKYEQLPEVSNVVTLAALMPADQEVKLEMLRDIQQRLRKLPNRGEIIKHATPNLDDIGRTGTRILRKIADLQAQQPHAALAKLQSSVERLMQTIHKGRVREGDVPGEPELSEPERSANGSPGASPSRITKHALQEYEQWITRDLADDLHRLRDVSTPTPIRLDDLPANLRERYIGKNGKWLVRIFSKDCLWDFEPLENFVAQIRTVEPGATGRPFTTLEGLKAMQSGFLWAGVYALIVMVLVLLLDFGRVKQMLVALLPLAHRHDRDPWFHGDVRLFAQPRQHDRVPVDPRRRRRQRRSRAATISAIAIASSAIA